MSEVGSVTVRLETALFRLVAIQKAAYRMGGRCFVELHALPDAVDVRLTPRREGESLDALAGELRNEALDQELREVIAAETEAVRNLILAQAFSKTSLLDEAGETGDLSGDPLGLTKPEAG